MRIGFFPLLIIVASALLWPQSAYHPNIPKTWDEGALADWATPVLRKIPLPNLSSVL